MNIPEADWKLFKPLRDKALMKFCDSILLEITAISADKALTSHERYLKIYSLTRKRDAELSRIFDGYSRSKALLQMAMIQTHDLLEPEALECFSESTREYLAGFGR